MENGTFVDEDDFFAVTIIRNCFGKILQSKCLDSTEIIGIGKGLYILEQFPNNVSGSDIEISISTRRESDGYSRMDYVQFLIKDTYYEVSTGGSIYDPEIGSDNLTGPFWSLDLKSGSEGGSDLNDIDDRIWLVMNDEYDVTVNDDSDFRTGAEHKYEIFEKQRVERYERIINSKSSEYCKRISENVISQLVEMETELLSGEDSGLRNVWEEVCDQVQFEESIFWDAYVFTIRDLIAKELKLNSKETIEMIWFQTDEFQWLSNDCDNACFDINMQATIDYILYDHILVIAADYEINESQI